MRYGTHARRTYVDTVYKMWYVPRQGKLMPLSKSPFIYNTPSHSFVHMVLYKFNEIWRVGKFVIIQIVFIYYNWNCIVHIVKNGIF